MKVKDLQRQSYFMDLEKRRKRIVIKQLEDDLRIAKDRLTLKKKLKTAIKKEVCRHDSHPCSYLHLAS